VKAGLPHRGVVEQALDENHFRIGLSRFVGQAVEVRRGVSARERAVWR
jgi:hypothetical protein